MQYRHVLARVLVWGALIVVAANSHHAGCIVMHVRMCITPWLGQGTTRGVQGRRSDQMQAAELSNSRMPLLQPAGLLGAARRRHGTIYLG